MLPNTHPSCATMSNARLIALWEALVIYGDEMDDRFAHDIKVEFSRRRLDQYDPEEILAETVDGEASAGELARLLEERTPVRGVCLVSGRIVENGHGVRGKCICDCGREANLSACFDVGGAWVDCPGCGFVTL